MMEIVRRCFPPVRRGKACRLIRSSREPTQLHREDIFQNLPEEEGRQGNTNHGEHRYHVIACGILMGCRGNTERDRDQKFKHRSNGGNHKGRTDSIRAENFRQNRTLVEETSAEIKLTNVGYPVQISFEDVSVQTVRCVHLLFEIFGNRIAARRKRLDTGINEVRRHTTEQRIQNEGNTQQNQNGYPNSFENIFKHLNTKLRKSAYFLLFYKNTSYTNSSSQSFSSGLEYSFTSFARPLIVSLLYAYKVLR